MKTFVADGGVEGIPHLADTDGAIWGHLGVTTQPYWVFVSADGEVTRMGSGGGEAAVEAQLEAMAA